MSVRTCTIAAVAAVVAMTPAAVHAVTPAADEAVITVRVGGDRTSGATTDDGPAAAAFTGVAGARLGLFAAPDDPAPVPRAWATCVSDAAGDCSFRVPQTEPGGVNRDARFTVKQLDSPSGWTPTTELATRTVAEGRASTPYRFLTGPELRAGTTYSSTSDFMRTPATTAAFDVATASSGVWTQSRVNPPVPAGCGLDVALIFDTSGSVGAALPQLIGAADSLVDALTGTRSRAAAFSFAALSPGDAAGPNHPALVPISTTAGAAGFKQQYARWGISGGTSWDRGLFVPAAAPEHYDVAVVITDGDPTTYGDPTPVPGSMQATRFKELEYGIASANALKAEGTRVIALGVGSGIGLAPISGPTAYDGSNAALADSFSLSDYAAAGSALHDLAIQLCQGSVSVVTQLVPAGPHGPDVSGASPVGAGWGVTASTKVAGTTGLPHTALTTDDGTGTVTFPLGFPSGVGSVPVTFAETAPSGHHRVVTQGGRNAVCRDLRDQQPVATVDVQGAGLGGFQVAARPDAAISCTVYVAVSSAPEPPGASALQLRGRLASVRDVDDDGLVGAGDEVFVAYRVTNTAGAPLRNLMVVSPAIGAVICPRSELAPSESTTCVAHAPYVVTTHDVDRGSALLRARAEAWDVSGERFTSILSATTAWMGRTPTVGGPW